MLILEWQVAIQKVFIRGRFDTTAARFLEVVVSGNVLPVDTRYINEVLKEPCNVPLWNEFTMVSLEIAGSG